MNKYTIDDLIVHTSKIEEEYFDHNLKVGGHGANFSKFFKLNRIGVHVMRIPVGFRTSRPHAEKCEDELVYVISGKVDLWFNGRIKKMQPSDAIGFPAGTGIGHTFINNSDAEVCLFVVGERTKTENQYNFHLGPDLKNECKDKWWSDMPVQELGGHDGLPGTYDQSVIDESIQTLHGFELLKSAQSFSYPNDTETFGHGTCLSREFKIGTFAVWLERLSPGFRSAWPHAHSVEEEFVFILEGNPTLWLNSIEYDIGAFSVVDFKAGSGIAHVVLNKTQEDLFYLCVGECAALGDQIYYPENSERNEEMKKKGLLWENNPTVSLF